MCDVVATGASPPMTAPFPEAHIVPANRAALLDKVVAALRQLESQRFGNGATVIFRDVDFNLLSFEEQVSWGSSRDGRSRCVCVLG